MNDPKYLFQYCQKLVIFSEDDTKILLAKRKGEADMDAKFSFIGGKMEISDSSLMEGMKREKDEEIGSTVKLKVCPNLCSIKSFVKKDGNYMILPSFYAQYVGGEVQLNPHEYSEYRWVAVDDLETFEPLVPDIPGICKQILRLKTLFTESDFVEI